LSAPSIAGAQDGMGDFWKRCARSTLRSARRGGERHIRWIEYVSCLWALPDYGRTGSGFAKVVFAEVLARFAAKKFVSNKNLKPQILNRKDREEMLAKNAKGYICDSLLIFSVHPFNPWFSPRDAERGLSDIAN
jgi:hypothetical protein